LRKLFSTTSGLQQYTGLGTDANTVYRILFSDLLQQLTNINFSPSITIGLNPYNTDLGCLVVGGYPIFTDGITLWLLWLTCIITFIVQLVIQSESPEAYKSQLFLITVVQILVLFCFTTRDLLHFFLGFEAMLAPLFFLIGTHGTRSERTRASFYLFIFTLAGSIFL
jgi:formate hydrogenlyase subunit 3/multisubunit Na+/H+ antiporter MnhD subunit